MRRLRTRRRSSALAILLVVLMGATACGGTEDRTTLVTAMFTDASPLVVGFTVRSHGVKVGEIESISVQDGVAAVQMRIDDEMAVPMHNDASARIRPVSLLGERYVDFDRGTASAPVVDAGTPIPVERTGSAVELHDVLDAVDQPTGTALSALVTTLGEGLQGRGADLDATIRELAPTLQRTDDLVSILNDQNAVLTELIERSAPVSRALASDGGADLDRLLASTESLLRTTSANQEAFDATLKRLPETLANARTTLARLAGVSEAGTETLGRLRPFTDALPEITGEIRTFTAAADPALASLEPVLEHAQQLMDEAQPLVRSLLPAGADLRVVASSSRPIVDELTMEIDSVMGLLRNWSLSTNGFDGISNYFRGVAIVDPTMATGVAPDGVLPVEPQLPGPVDESLPVPEPPDLPTDEIGGADPGNATGLNPDQEQNLFDQLLGGS